MPRRSSSGGRSGRYGGRPSGGGYYSSSSSSRPSSSQRYSSYSSSQRISPQNSGQTTMPINQPRGMGLGGALATGMAFGGGSAIGHSLVGGMMGHRSGGYGGEMTTPQNTTSIDTGAPAQQQGQNEPIKNPCYEYGQRFVNCLKDNTNDISRCQNIFDELKMCEKTMI